MVWGSEWKIVDSAFVLYNVRSLCLIETEIRENSLGTGSLQRLGARLASHWCHFRRENP